MICGSIQLWFVLEMDKPVCSEAKTLANGCCRNDRFIVETNGDVVAYHINQH
jgi:hypothetical protein